MTIAIRTPFTATLVLGLGLLTRLASADCTKDTDCKGARVCSKGECVDPAPATSSVVIPPIGVAPAPVAPPAVAQPGPGQYPPPPQPPPGYGQPVYVMAPPPYPMIPTFHYAHPGMRRAGIGLFITGAVIDLAGTITYVAGANAESTYCADGNSGCQHGATAEEVGEVLWGLGGVFTVTGLILWWSGGSLVPGPDPAETGWLSHITPYASPTKDGGRAGLHVTF